MIKVLIIDDHALLREGLKRALSMEKQLTVIGEAASRAEGFAQISHHNPDVIVVDLNLPDGSGLDIVSWARSISKKIGIVVLTMTNTPEYILACLQAGASAHVDKAAPIAEVVAAIHHCAINPLSFASKQMSEVLKYKKDSSGLTARELDVLALLPTGLTTIEIATALFVTESTIKTHLSSIYRKMESTNRTQAINAARKRGLLQ